MIINRYYLRTVIFFSLFLLWNLCPQQLPAQEAGSGYTHPHILVKADDKAAILEKMQRESWARQAFDEIEQRVAPYVERHKTDPQWILSRYLMNRIPGRRYTHFYSDPGGTKLIRYGGDAPYPTVRVSPHKRPPITADGYSYRMPSIEELIPYDTSMLMHLQSTAPGGEWAWIDPQSFVGDINTEINNLALDAAIVYWLTGKEPYAVFAADLLTQWARGASCQQPIDGPCRTGFLDIQTLGDAQSVPMILAYDFLYDFLHKKGYETGYYETVFQKIARTMTFRGFWNNNWFAAQTPAMVFSALSLGDKKLRDYYLDFYLHKDTINGACGHLALPSVVQKWLTPDGHWKEPGGYHNYPVGNLLLSALAMEKNGYPVFRQFPALFKASYVMLKYSFPNFKALAFGDNGSRPSQSPSSLEIALLMAQKYHQQALSDQLAAAMDLLLDHSPYERSASGYVGLLCYLPEIPSAHGARYAWPRSGQLDYAKCYLQRNGSDSLHGLMYIVQGATYNHNHANGMAMELYGAGSVMGADPGKGLTYEAPLHVSYYAQWAAHNTVVAGSRSGPVPAFHGGGGAKRMGHITLAAMEPLPEKEAVSPRCSFTDTRYTDIATGSKQQRTMAIIRTSDTTGYYIDIYRSDNPADNEYLYHNIGNSVQLFSGDRQPLTTRPATFPMSKAPFDPPGFRAMSDYRTTGNTAGGVIALFDLKADSSHETFMQVLLPGEKERAYYTAGAPRTRTAPPPYRSLSTPVLICRQEGEAWSRPFIAVYEPFSGAGNYQVATAGQPDHSQPGIFTALKVKNRDKSEQLVLQSLDSSRTFSADSCTFRGCFGVAGLMQNRLAYLYLGKGKKIACKNYILTVRQGQGAANLIIDGSILRVSCNGAAGISVPQQTAAKVILKEGTKETVLPFTKTKTGITFTVPAVSNATIRIVE